MSRTHKDTPNSKQNRPKRSRQRNISVRAVRRDPPDLRKLSRALISLAMAEAEAEVQEPTNTSTTNPAAANSTAPEPEPERSPDA